VLVSPNRQATSRAENLLAAVDAAGVVPPTTSVGWPVHLTLPGVAYQPPGIPAHDLARYMGSSLRVIDLSYRHPVRGSEEAARAGLRCVHERGRETAGEP